MVEKLGKPKMDAKVDLKEMYIPGSHQRNMAF
jgi:hypothetical protein